MEIVPETYTLSSLPDETKMCILIRTYTRYKKKKLLEFSQIIATLRLTEKSFNRLLSDEKLISLLNLKKVNINDLLFEAVQKEAPFFVHITNKAGGNVNYYHEKRQLTPLLQATFNEDYITCKLLLSQGADVNKNNRQPNANFEDDLKDIYAPIHIAITKNNLPLTKLFIDAGADLSSARFDPRFKAFISEPHLVSSLALAKKYNCSKKIIKLIQEKEVKKKDNCSIQ
jgi:ankyrin repeat protein